MVLIMIIAFMMLAYRIFVRRLIREKELLHETEMQHQKSMLDLSISIQEKERKRIATMLHDDVGNKLNILSVWINNPDSWNSVRSREVITQQMPVLIETTRNISHSLYPANLERVGLILTLSELITNVESSLKINLIVIHKYESSDIAVEVQVYRIIQEFMSNVLKHAGASEMNIHLRNSSNKLRILVTDNGKGFDTGIIKRGMGLGNIEFRLNSLNADFKWKSVIGKGSRLIISIPQNEQ
ncbi:MAG: histidine kinase [Bacteroidetes bacterium HGW-Bacteroidetes-6]|nr:MAG: histidine kinase [Bacteroidetes bacterium HGW-Bacteroidetes-6]